MGAKKVFREDENKNLWLPIQGSGEPRQHKISFSGFWLRWKSFLDYVLVKPKESCH